MAKYCATLSRDDSDPSVFGSARFGGVCALPVTSGPEETHTLSSYVITFNHNLAATARDALTGQNSLAMLQHRCGAGLGGTGPEGRSGSPGRLGSTHGLRSAARQADSCCGYSTRPPWRRGLTCRRYSMHLHFSGSELGFSSHPPTSTF